ncbi:carbamoyl-phosphate synthase small chain [Desulfoluna limicola]|uniref:Carbamoyl phosphate synthase small chain n=1 Tax=Desulfoluna limicola TaxID=2810562 RepID=A0ABM7PM05_9BACT|nr:glutamine-hydrolyzing carbamoyl-phosphate synthase small subunit [Desulfoluna limicola]BCS98129.1 carbamoyl-phosphate synthase small chain [Desulfoluna limicola]
MKALLALEDGRIFSCRSFTGPGEVGGEVVFNTSMTGYQEILTDPSYRGQMVTMTYPLIGNYGVNRGDVESSRIQASALIVREYQDDYSNWQADMSLADYLKASDVVGIDELDTRALTLHLRTKGAMRGIISTDVANPEALVEKAKALPSMEGCDLASQVTTEKAYRLVKDTPVYINEPLSADLFAARGEKKSVVALDFGIKFNIIRLLEASSCEVIVVPATTPADVVKAMNPDGVFLSNGPGDPEPVLYAVETVKSLIGFRPIFGICLGHQIMSIALGGKTYKLKFGHRGGNQPVQNTATEKVEITSQNHGFAADMDSLANADVDVSHINLNDRTVEGLRHRVHPVLSVQYHPEASPGPNDAQYLFDEFVSMMDRFDS